MERIASSDRRLTGREWRLVSLAAACCGALRLALAERRGFWLDEYYTLQAAIAPFAEMIPERFSAGHSPLPFLYARIFAVLFGTSETALRASSALAAALATVAVAGLAVRLGLRRLLFPLLIMAVFHPYWQVIGTEFRYMMPLAAAGAFWSWAVVAHFQERRRATAALVAGTGAVALWLHGSAQFILAALAIWTVLELRARSERARAAVAPALDVLLPLGAAFALCLPLVVGLGMMPKVTAEATPDVPSLRKVFVNEVHTFFADDLVFTSATGLQDELLGLPCLALFVGAMAAAVRCFRRRDEPAEAGRYLLAMLVGLPLTVMVITATGKDVEGPARYVAFLSVPGLLLMALLWDEAGRSSGLRRAAVRVSMVIVIGTAWSLQALNQGEWHRETIRWLAEHRRPGQPIVTAGRSMNLLALRYHGVPWNGAIQGIASDQEELAVALNLVRLRMNESDSLFFLLYHEGDVPVGEVLERLRSEGTLRHVRIWQPTGKVTLLGLARTEKGQQEIEALPPIATPRFTSSPLRERERRDLRWGLTKLAGS